MKTILICKTVKDGPSLVDAETDHCSYCGEEIWTSSSGINSAEKNSKEDDTLMYMCIHCIISQCEIMDPSYEQLEELSDVIGCDIEAAQEYALHATELFKRLK